MKKILFVLPMMALSFGSFAADYSKCSDFLRTPNSGFGGNSISGINYVPFTLNDDGSLNVHESVVSQSTNEETRVTEIEFMVPDYMAMYQRNAATNNEEAGFNGGWNSVMPQRKAKMIVRRNSAGEITEIINDQNFTQEELDQMMEAINRQYEANTTEEQRNANKEMAEQFGGEFRLPFFAPNQTSISFEIKNGECVPMEVVNSSLTEAKTDGQSISVTNHSIPLCRDLHEYFEANPDAKACLKAQANRGVEEIFANYSSLDVNPDSEFQMGFGGPGSGYFGGGFPGVGMGGPYGGGYNGVGFMGLRQQMLMSAFFGPEHQREQFYNRFGNSPVISASRILQSCIDLNLERVITSDSIWAEPAPSTPATATDGGSATPESE